MEHVAAAGSKSLPRLMPPAKDGIEGLAGTEGVGQVNSGSF
ncbi:hypothetical protein AFFFEF_00482 [Methylorubrum extorquens]